jgi:uncharacterized protein (DUF427 family)
MPRWPKRHEQLEGTMAREHLIPGPNHPITIEPANVRVVVSADGMIVADTSDALVLREASYPPAYYLPLGDVSAEAIRHSDTKTYCPYKGDASYYDVSVPGHDEIADAGWVYAEPYPEVADIAGHVSFYPDRVQITTER